MKKILFVQKAFGQPSEVFLYRMVTSFPKFDVNVLSGKYVNKENFPFDTTKLHIWQEEKVHFLQKIIPFINAKMKFPGRHSWENENIIQYINKSNADIVCFQMGFLPVEMGTDIKKINKKICLIHHGTDVNRAIENMSYRKRLLRVWQSVDTVIFVSHFLKNVAVKSGCPKNKTLVHYLGVPDISSIYQKTVHDDIFRFIMVGRMTPVKNHLRVLQAFALLVEKTSKKVELILIGDGELKQEIENTIKNLDIEKYVQLLGALPNQEVLTYMANANTSILVSQAYIIPGVVRQEEGLPISLLEGASLGLPLIGSKTGGIPEIIEDGKNGYLIDPLDKKALLGAMHSLVEDHEKCLKMGKKSQEVVKEKFCFERQMNKLENIFLELIEK